MKTEVVRCAWAASTPDYIRYHDEEWGRPRLSNDEVFERICLEGFQAGLAWITILRKREAFRAAFRQFSIEKVARFGERDVARLMADAGIVRSRAKIDAAIGNARAALALLEMEPSLAHVVWEHAPRRPPRPPRAMSDIPAITAGSTALSKRLKAAGFRFVGPTTMYALFQALGVVNDHLVGCPVREAVAREQQQALQRLR
jgi:DNA-3-methyladenine glycosylase I